MKNLGFSILPRVTLIIMDNPNDKKNQCYYAELIH
jgi:hypothetical protein